MNEIKKHKTDDPAVLFYTKDWLVATASMSPDCRGWYINLLCHQHDKKGLPNDIEDLAQLANVKFSDFKRFQEGFEEELRSKFELNEDTGLLVNLRMNQIMQSRELFKKKRSYAGKIGFLTKVAMELTNDSKEVDHLKDVFDFDNYDGNKQVLKDMLKQMLKHYRNANEDVNINVDKIEFDIFWNAYSKKTGSRPKLKKKWDNLSTDEQEEVMVHIPKYIISQPDKQYRKNPETYLNNEGWKDELITKSDGFAVGQKFQGNGEKKRDY